MDRIVFLDRATIGPTVTIGKPGFAHEWIEHQATAEAEVARRLADATIAITNKVPIREADARPTPPPQDDRGRRYRLRRRRRARLPGARHRRRQRPGLRGQHRARARLRADPGAAPLADRLPPGRHRRRMAARRPVLLLQSPDPGAARLDARDHGRGRYRAGRRPARPGLRHADALCGPQGRPGSGPFVHAIRAGARRERHRHAALSTHAEHAEHAGHAGIRADEATATSDQRVTRRLGQRARSGDGARAGFDHRRRLRLPHLGTAGQGPPLLADPRSTQRHRHAARGVGE